MSSRAQWIVTWVGIAAAVLGVVFFIATQTISWRDIIVVTIGAVLGAMVAAFVSTWVFHADRRKNTQAAEREAATISATAEAERLSEAATSARDADKLKASAEASAIQVKAEAEADAIRTRADADVQLALKRAELLSSAPKLKERLSELRTELALNQQNVNTADASARASYAQAQEAGQAGFADISAERHGIGANWEIAAQDFRRQGADLAAEIDRLAGMTDEEYRSEHARQRGIQ